MKYLICIFFILRAFGVHGQIPDCGIYQEYKTQAEALHFTDPKKALLKYESMLECDPERARKDSVAEHIVDIFRKLHESQQNAERFAREAEKKKQEAVASEKKLNAALQKSYRARARKEFDAGQFETALFYSRKIRKAPGESLGVIDSVNIKQHLSTNIVSGRRISEDGPFKDYFYDREGKTFTNSKAIDEKWNNIPEEPKVIQSEFDTTGTFLIFNQSLEGKADQCETVILEARPGLAPQLAGKFVTPFPQDLRVKDYYEYFKAEFITDGVLLLGIRGYSDSKTSSLISLTNKNSLYFEKAIFNLKKDIIEVHYEKNGNRIFEKYQLPALELIHHENKDTPPQKTEFAKPSEPQKPTESIVHTTVRSIGEMEVFKSETIIGKKRNSYGLYFKKDTSATPLLLMESGYSFDRLRVYFDSVRQQLMAVLPYSSFVFYDIRSDSTFKIDKFDEVLYAPESGSESRFLRLSQLTDSLLSQSNGQDGFVFFNSYGYKIKSWGRGQTHPEAIKNVEYFKLMEEVNGLFYRIQSQKDGIGYFHAELVDNTFKMIKSWAQVTKISPFYGGYYSPHWGFVEYADSTNGSRSVDVIYQCEYQSESNLKIISIKNTAIDSLRFEDQYLFQKARTSAGKPIRKIYTPFKYGLDKDAFLLNTIYFPDSLILRGEIPESEKYSDFDINEGILFHIKNCATCTETNNYYYPNRNYDFYSLPDLQLLGQVLDADNINVLRQDIPQMLEVTRPDSTVEILDLATGKSALQANWKKIHRLKFLDSLKTLLMVEYSEDRLEYPYTEKWRVDILTYPKFKKVNSFEYGKGQKYGSDWNTYWGNHSKIIREKYLYIFTDYVDSTDRQQLQLFKIKTGKLEFVQKWEAGSDFRVAYHSWDNILSQDTFPTYDPDTYAEKTVVFSETYENGLYVSKDFALYFEQPHRDSALSTTLYSLEPFKKVKTWKNVYFIDSIEANILKIHFEEPECTELFDWKNQKILEPCHNSGRPEYFAGTDPKNPSIDHIKLETVFEDEKYRLICQKTFYHYGSGYLTRDYKLASKHNKKETVWSEDYRYRFDRKNERLFLFYRDHHDDNKSSDKLIVYDCKNNFKKLHHFTGEFLSDGYDIDSKRWWNGKIKIDEKLNTGLVCFAERDTTDKTKFSIHFIDTVLAKNYYHVITCNNQQHLTFLGDFMLIHTDISNKKDRLEIFDLKTFKFVPDAVWSVQEGNAHAWEKIGRKHLGIWEAGTDKAFLIYSLDSLKTRFRYRQADQIRRIEIQTDSTEKTILVLPNNRTEITSAKGERQTSQRFNLDVFEGQDFNKLLYRFEHIRDYNFAGRLLFIAKDKAIALEKNPDWEVYDLGNKLKKLGTWENSTFENDPPCLLSNETTDPNLDLDRPEKDRRKVHDLTFFNSRNPDIRLTVAGASRYSSFENLIVVENDRNDRYKDYRLYHSGSFEAIGEWKQSRYFYEYEWFKRSDSIVVVEYNCRTGSCDMDLLHGATFEKIDHYDYVSDFVELEGTGNFGLIRRLPTDTTRTIGEIRRVSDGKLSVTFSRDYPFGFYYHRSAKIIYLIKTGDNIETLAFLGGKLYLLPPDHLLVNDSIFIRCEGKLYSIAATKETISEEVMKYDWVVQVYDHTQSGSDLPPLKVKDFTFKILVEGEGSEYLNPVLKYDEKNACECTITIGSINRIEKLKK